MHRSSAALLATATFVFAAGSASAATTTCSSVAACVMGTNSSSGPGVGGTSKSGFGLSGISTSGHGVNGTSSSSFGVVGITTENATSTGTARAGVLGEDLSTNKKAFNTGVGGSSTYGFGGSFTSTNGTGVSGTGGNTGGSFTGGLGVNVVGKGDGFHAYSSNGFSNPSEDGTVSAAIAGYARTGPYASGGGNDDDAFRGFACFITPDKPNNEDCGEETSSISGAGDANFSSVTTDNGTYVRTKSIKGPALLTYGSRTSTPTLEDFGQASLVRGVAHVAIESAFASTIDLHSYMVFITPQGDSRGLYTAGITPSGFDVRENQGGRSTLTFAYRIVAHPLDTKLARLPLAKRRSPVANRFTGTR